MRLVERPDADVLEVAAEHVGRQVEAIRPDAEFWIIRKQVRGLQRVEVPASAQRVSAARDGETLEVRGDRIAQGVSRKCKVGDDPAIGAWIPHDNGIAEILVVAGVAEIALTHQRIEAEASRQRAVALAKDADRRVHGLNVVDGSDIAVRIRRPAIPEIRKVQSEEIAGAAAAAG